jgi:hypothetical protein
MLQAVGAVQLLPPCTAGWECWRQQQGVLINRVTGRHVCPALLFLAHVPSFSLWGQPPLASLYLYQEAGVWGCHHPLDVATSTALAVLVCWQSEWRSDGII